MNIVLELKNLSGSLEEFKKIIQSFKHPNFMFDVEASDALENNRAYKYLVLLVHDSLERRFEIKLSYVGYHLNNASYIYEPETNNEFLNEALLELGRHIVKETE